MLLLLLPAKELIEELELGGCECGKEEDAEYSKDTITVHDEFV